MKTLRGGGYVAVAFAYAYACGGSPAPSMSPASTNDGGAAESGDDVDSGLVSHGRDAGGDARKDASGRSEGGAETGAADDGGTSGAPYSTSNQYCCVSGAFYACPTDAALAKCTGFDVSGCLHGCASADTACQRACNQNATSPDPSGCTHDPGEDSLCLAIDAGSSYSVSGSGSSSPPPVPTNACGGLFPGNIECGVGGACIGGGHCAGNRCYPNDVGNPCTYAMDCGDGNHCTNGCCASPAKGSACTAFWDCKSNTCTNGICQ